MDSSTSTAVISIATTLLNNSTRDNCTGKLFSLKCNLVEFGHTFAYFLLAMSLLPQFFRFFKYQQRYIAGISYMWIIIRIIALTTLMSAHRFQWSSLLEFCALIVTILIFYQVVYFSNNLHRQNKIILATTAIFLWFLTKIVFILFVRQRTRLLTIGYVLLGVQMLPQILLNSFLRTAKALSKFSIILLAMSDVLLFVSLPNARTTSIQLISIYYSFSFVLFVLLQNFVYYDEHIHLISRSAHTLLTPGVDLYTGIDVINSNKNAQESHTLPSYDVDQIDDEDIIYQKVTETKPLPTVAGQTLMQKFLWYAILACIFCIEAVATLILIYRVGSGWVIFVPLSIVFILGIFHVLRTKLPDSFSETLRKIL